MAAADVHRNLVIDLLKVIGIFLVVWGHSVKNDFVVNMIYSFHMPLFFFVSGFLVRDRPFGNAFKKMVLGLLVPYFVLNLAFIAWDVVGSIKSGADHYMAGVFGYLRGMLWGRSSGDEMIMVPLWFLPCLFCAELIHWGFARKPFAVQLGVAFVLIEAVFLCDALFKPSFPWGFSTAIIALPFIILGRGVKELPELSRISFAGWGAGLLAFSVGSALVFDRTSINSVSQDAIFLYYIRAMFGIFGLYFLCKSLQGTLVKSKALLLLVSNSTIVVLAFHYHFLQWEKRVLFLLGAGMQSSWFLMTAAESVVAVVLSVLVYVAINRFVPWVAGKRMST